MDEADIQIPLSPELAQRVMTTSPLGQDLGFKLLRLERARAVVGVDYQEKLIGNPVTGVVHGGLITALLDHASAVAAIAALDKPTSIATLDMRIDYMRAAEPGRRIIGDATCFKLTKSIAFIRGTAYHDSADDPIATVVCTYMLASDGGRKPGVNLK
ncbi:MAG: PaaI family thioesterase [Alphaproteobacteria bacterium]